MGDGSYPNRDCECGARLTCEIVWGEEDLYEAAAELAESLGLTLDTIEVRFTPNVDTADKIESEALAPGFNDREWEEPWPIWLIAVRVKIDPWTTN